MDGAGRQFLARARRAEDEDGRIGAGVAQQVGLERVDGRAVAQNGIDGIAGPERALDAPGVGMDLLVEEFHALEERLHLFRRIEQGHGESTDDLSRLVAERDAVDEEFRLAVVYLTPRAQIRFSGSDDRRNPRVGDKVSDVSADGVFRANAQVVGVGVVDEADDALPVADEQPRGQVAHGEFEEAFVRFL